MALTTAEIIEKLVKVLKKIPHNADLPAINDEEEAALEYLLESLIDNTVDEVSIDFDGERAIKAIPTVSQIPGGETVNEFLENIFFPFIPSTLSLNSFSLVEEGTQVTPTLNGLLTINDEGSPSNGVVLVNGAPSGTFAITSPPANTVISQPAPGAVTADTTYQLRADVDNNGSPGTISSPVRTLDFIYPFFWGVSVNAALSGTTLYSALTKAIQAQGNKSVVFNASAEYLYFAYPNNYPDLTSILDPNSFEVLGSFTKSDPVSVTSVGLFSNYTRNYKVYRSNSLTTINGTFQFKF